MKIPPIYQQKWTASERTATEVAETIMAKWREAGHLDVCAWVERIEMKQYSRKSGAADVKTLEIIRSNLVNGLPPSVRQQAA